MDQHPQEKQNEPECLLESWESIVTPTALHFSEVSEDSIQTEI
jgi:hypothetical protein